MGVRMRLQRAWVLLVMTAITLPGAISTNIGTGTGVKPDNPAPNRVVLELKTNTGIQPSPTLTPTPPQRQRP